MFHRTTAVADQYDIGELETIDAHPTVVAEAEKYRQLRDEQQNLAGRLVEAQKAIFLGESGGGDALTPLRSLREARREREGLQEALENIQGKLTSAHEVLEGARAAARAELRPRLKEEAAEALALVLELNERLQAAQQQLHDLHTRSWRLGVWLVPPGCLDRFLPSRIQLIRQMLGGLQG
jgi:chromosome segregation ATPase